MDSIIAYSKALYLLILQSFFLKISYKYDFLDY